MRFKQDTVPKALLFVLSPFVALPAIIYGIYRKSNFSLILLVLLFGVLSFLYTPNISNDRARYFEAYQNFQGFDFSQFLLYLSNGRADFILHLLIFIATKIKIPLQAVLFLVTSFTTGVWFYLFSEFVGRKYISNFKYFACFLLVLFSFSLPDLFSGIRFYFSSSFIVLGFYKGLFEEKKAIGILLFAIAIFIHFSATLFLPIYFFLILSPNKSALCKYIFLFSLLFIILPKTFILSIVEMVSISGGYDQKVDLYLNGDDLVEGGLQNGSANYIYVYLFSIAWSFFAYIYLIFTINRKSLIRNLMYLTFGAVNLFYAVPTIYARYLIILKFLFVLLLIYELVELKITKPVLITLILLSVSILSNVIILREIIAVSYFKSDIFTLPTILSREITPKDFIY